MRLKIIHLTSIVVVLLAALGPAALAQAQDIVGLPGTHQDELGCSGEWQPDCDKTLLQYDAEDDVWQAAFEIQPGNDGDKKGPRYKVALNGNWAENYGLNATGGGADIPLVVSAPTLVKFYYDSKTHWITDNFNTPIFVAVGDFQTQLGCAANNDAGCLRSWLEDPEGDGVYSFLTRSLKAGDYTVALTQNEDAANIVSAAQTFTVKKDNDAIYFGFDAGKGTMSISTSGAPVGNLTKLKAQWVSKDTLLWKVANAANLSFALVYSPEAALELVPEGIKNGVEIPLTFVTDKMSVDLVRAYPYLNGYSVFQVTENDPAVLAEVLRGQVAVIARSVSGAPVDAAGVQIPGVLDDLYEYTGPLGVTYEGANGDVPTLRVWAPTAQSITVHLFDTAVASYAQKLPMTFDSATGVWSLAGQADWTGKFYLYEVKVFTPLTGKLETNLVTDPYSFSLSTNGKRSQIVNLSDAALKPEGWDAVQKPALAAPEDAVIYELHIRDFSISDQTVPTELRGTYRAFTVKDSDGMKHLAALAEAGLTHIHLLPAFDIASVNEDKSTWQSADEAELAAYPPDSEEQAAAVRVIKGADGFNWGYDPIHYTAPDGSYATDPNGTPRIVEFRAMVQALNASGLRVVMDVVYNHTNASGQSENSVFDKIVPGYYHRLNTDGNVEKSTCCENTATEHEMMRKLMIDSVVTWATQYKVDGFRFDLMGHHMLADMQAVRAALDALTLEQDGVNGQAIYVYGEGWDFGEVASNKRGKNASQLNIGGTGIGVFNDRLRDAVRGGSPFSDPRQQGFATGLLLTNNANEKRAVEDQQIQLMEYSDLIRLSLAGNLAGYEVMRADGKTVPGRLIGYNQGPAGYTADPQENIIYVSAHDNETIFDAVQVKAPAEATLADRIRMNNLALSLAMFSQGVPFFHAGDDLLRSKSLDRNSYDSGDWFNKLDWSLQSNNWGVGLPIEGTDRWDLFRPLLADPALKPAPADIQNATLYFRELLQIRKSSPLFRLQTAAQIKQSVSFLNTGPEQKPGLIVVRLQDVAGIDSQFSDIVVLFNSSPEAMAFTDASLTGGAYELHPVQQKSVDTVTQGAKFDAANQMFVVPGRTTAVFVVKRAALPTEVSATATPNNTILLPSVGSTGGDSAPASTPPATSPALLGGLALAALAGLGLMAWLRRKK